GAAFAAAAHQEGGGAEFGGQLGRQDRLGHRRLSKIEALRRRGNKKPRSRAGQGSSTVPDLLAHFFTWSRKPVGSNQHEHLSPNLWMPAGQADHCPMLSQRPRRSVANRQPAAANAG